MRLRSIERFESGPSARNGCKWLGWLSVALAHVASARAVLVVGVRQLGHELDVAVVAVNQRLNQLASLPQQ